jgi:hypothetical protein
MVISRAIVTGGNNIYGVDTFRARDGEKRKRETGDMLTVPPSKRIG